MDDARPSRLASGFLWAAGVLALEVAFWVGLGWIVRWRMAVASGLYLLLVVGARWWTDDRFRPDHLLPILLPIAALLWAIRIRPRLLPLLACFLALPGLDGRVPTVSVSLLDTLLFLLPSLVAVVVFVMLGGRDAGWWRVLPAGTVALAIGLVAPALPHLLAPAVLAPDPAPPNLLLVVVDTLRRDHVQPYGDRAVTPELLAFSRSGVRFEDAVTVVPKTAQSVASLFTGRYPIHHGVRSLAGRLGSREVTLAESLRGQGFATAAFVHNGWLDRGRGFEQGFDQFWSFHEIEGRGGPLRWASLPTLAATVMPGLARPFDGNTDAREVTDRALTWIGGAKKPFFAYLHYFDPHWPYRPEGRGQDCLVNSIETTEWSRGEMIFHNPLPDAENRRAKQLYAEEVRHTSREIGRLLAGLDAAGLRDETVVVVTADHGHSLGEHDYWYHHGEFLYEPEVTIPLLIRVPGSLDDGSIRTEPIRTIDLLPTLLQSMGLALPPGKLDGVDVLEAPAPPTYLEADDLSFRENDRRWIPGSLGRPRAIRDRDWKLVYTPRPAAGVWELFDLSADPGELENLLASGKAEGAPLEAMRARLAASLSADERRRLEELGNRFDGRGDLAYGAPQGGEALDDVDAPELTDAEKAALRALGYLD